MAFIAQGPVTRLAFDEAVTAADPHDFGQLGMEVTTEDGSKLKLVRANGAVPLGALCSVDGGGVDAIAVDDDTYPAAAGEATGAHLGFAQAVAADNQLFWLLTVKTDESNTDFVALSAAAIAIDVQIATTATAGEIDDAAAGGSFDILGLHITTAVGSGTTFSTFKTAAGGMTFRDVAN